MALSKYSKMIGAAAAGAIGVGIGANFIPSLTTAEMYQFLGEAAAYPTDVWNAYSTIFTTVNGLLVGSISSAIGAYAAPANQP